MSETKWGMAIDVSKCISCNACTASCRIENENRTEMNRSWVTEEEVGKYPNVHVLKIPQLCNHCEVTPCIDVCPVEATGKTEDGIVFIDKEKCIGCFACVTACPYGARIKDEEAKKADKCDFCAHRVEQGLLPACISTCTTQARFFGNLNDENSEISKLIKENKTQKLLPEKNLEPNVYYISMEDYQALK